ncbi:uncharacterized protein TM35_000671110 [Trypanosoma theileri]|uniref:Mucin TcMUCII n=1 Tax=Trypanosoma theileri TaxID=67003 RepID=A0A1X0NFL8_9TRYP|nr:uncharacterized protein TM35_000671110 [Trypanosoma theileri]ORC83505.1 hypothetical protein TM35_000671110 [Trypanosoma theileri]
MMMRSVVCLLVFLLSVAFVCMDANAFTNEPGDKEVGSVCTSGTCTDPGNVFTALFNESLHTPTLNTSTTSSSGSSIGSSVREGQGDLHGTVLPTQEMIRTQDTHPGDSGALSREEQVDERSTDQEEGGSRADSQPAHNERGGESTSDTSSVAREDRSNSIDEAITTVQEQSQIPPSNPPSQGNPGSSNNTVDNTTTGNSNSTEQASPAAAGTFPTTASQENGNAESTATTTNTTTEAPTTTPSPGPAPPVSVTDTRISSIASTVQKKANVDSSVSPVWMRTAASLLIVVLLFSATMY